MGREIECGVLEGEAGGAPEASLLAEIRVVARTTSSTTSRRSTSTTPASTTSRPTCRTGSPGRSRSTPCRTFTALDCAGLARVDFFVTPELDVYLNEINTMPGFTPTSMFPRMWAASGLEYPKLVARLIRTALRRGTGLH